MAAISKKDKLIEEAQKLALRSQFDKAARIYEQLLAMEPTAINLRQKLAELLTKCGRLDDARKELENIGKHFSKNGFYLKAIAVYKQLQKLFPADISISIMLAELNEKHGLAANSLSEYKLVFEHFEKAGKITEALDILNKMQNVDPQNIPIKIKLAEACNKWGKKADAYSVFAKTAGMLLERNDTATLTKVCARVEQIFPDKTDFLFEVLSDQIRQGNASTAVDCIQSLLRNNPNNKPVWDLIVQAYQLLEQPQRVKVAYQHYLKFFPSEPAPMLGLIKSFTLEKNLTGTLELLDKYEQPLISAGCFQQLKEIYESLDKLDPLNIKILEGLRRVADAAGDESEARSIASKLQSLHSVSDKGHADSVKDNTLTDFTSGQTQSVFDTATSPFISELPSEISAVSDITLTESELSTDIEPDYMPSDAAVITDLQPDEEIEIDVEIDLDSPFGLPDQENDTSGHDDWLNSVGNLFDTIDTAPRGVKFGNEMDGSDAQSHFDLGQAFKEMGLYDEAINEFRQASQDPSKRVECLIMQCICLRERGELDKAITMLQALLQPGLTEEESCAVKYELATGYEVAGNKEGANLLLNEIKTTNPGFRDITSRINAANLSDSLDFSDEDLDDFGLK